MISPFGQHPFARPAPNAPSSSSAKFPALLLAAAQWRQLLPRTSRENKEQPNCTRHLAVIGADPMDPGIETDWKTYIFGYKTDVEWKILS